MHLLALALLAHTGIKQHTTCVHVQVDVAQHCWCNFLMTQETDQVLNEQNNVRLSHRADKVKGAAVLDCDLRVVQVPPTFQTKIPS